MTKNRVAICLVVVIILFQVRVVAAQNSRKPMEILGTQIDISLESGVNTTSYNLPLKQNWQEMFLPASGGMKPSEAKFPWASGLRLGLNRVLIGNSQPWQVRLLISYQILSLNSYINSSIATKFYFVKEGVATTTLNWWNTVVVNDLVVEHFTPRVGIEIVKGDYAIGLSVQHYRLIARDYRGEDHFGARNTSRVISSRQIESGVSPRVDLFFGGTYGMFIETMGGLKTIKLGLIVRWKIKEKY